MKHFAWNSEKNLELIDSRSISFERVVSHIEKHGYLDLIAHPNSEKYPKQKMFIIDLDNYAYLVPFIETESEYFLKTIIPSRKATKKIYRGKAMSQKLYNEEKELLESYDNDEWVSVSEDVNKYKAAARKTFKKNKRVNIRISEIDLELLKERALIEGLPYQTLMASVLHKYVTGRLS